MPRPTHPHADELDHDLPPTPPVDPGSRGSRLLAAFAATALVLAVVAMQFMGRHAAPEKPSHELPPPDLQMILVGRLAIGIDAIGDVAGPQANNSANVEQVLSQLDGLSKVAVRDQVRTAMVDAELRGPEHAQERLTEAQTALNELETRLDDPADAPDRDADRDSAERARIAALRDDIAALRSIYAAGDAHAADLPDAAREALVKRHGYFGDVALSFGLDDNTPAREDVRSAGVRTVVVLVGAFAVAMLALLVGFVLFVIAIVKLLSPRGLRPAYAPPSFGGSVYLETFALFLAGFVVVSLLGEPLSRAAGVSLDFVLPWLLVVVPFWPLVRGQRWSLHKHAIGWTRGRGALCEVGAGVVGYFTLLPVFVVGVLATILLTVLFSLVETALGRGEPEPLTHPIMERLVGGDVATYLVLLSLAAVWAPLVEETIFRGALFHHLRGRWRVAMSALVTGFVFAAIHPQGFAAIPALMGLGCSFALLREWRGSLIAPITAHAMHNGFLVTMLWLALS